MTSPYSGVDGVGVVGGGVAVVIAGALVNSGIDPSTKSLANNNTTTTKSALNSPFLIFIFFHKAIRSEIDSLHRAAVVSATTTTTGGGTIVVKSFLERYYFLRSVYKHHCNAEDEVIFPALDIRVKNVARTYFLEHEVENLLFNQLFELLNSKPEDEDDDGDDSYRRELASCTGALLTSISVSTCPRKRNKYFA